MDRNSPTQCRRFALSQKSDAILTGQSRIFEVEDDAADVPFRADQRFPTAQCALCRR